MIDIERMYKYMDLLEGKRFVTASEFMTVMEISHATFKRDLAVLRERFDIPIIFDRDVSAYKLDQTSNRRRIPGLWFSPEEIQVIRTVCIKISGEANTNASTPYQLLSAKLDRIQSRR
jgi:predicted DNA-binding transcriptional regulator YafY